MEGVEKVSSVTGSLPIIPRRPCGHLLYGVSYSTLVQPGGGVRDGCSRLRSTETKEDSPTAVACTGQRSGEGVPQLGSPQGRACQHQGQPGFWHQASGQLGPCLQQAAARPGTRPRWPSSMARNIESGGLLGEGATLSCFPSQI